PGQFVPGQFFPGRFFPGQFPPCMMMPGPPGNGQCAPGQSAPRRPAPGQGFPAGGFPLPFFRMPPFPAAPQNQFPCQGEQGGSGGQQMPCTGSRPQTRNSSEGGGEDVQPAVSILNDVLGTLFHASKYDRYYEE
ncbi:MAG: hypothetical protein Q4D81_10440, partial [Eubacteriales bacterium]|nr:hypothetical protein [Eubacteriales bacterium]